MNLFDLKNIRFKQMLTDKKTYVVCSFDHLKKLFYIYTNNLTIFN